MNQVRKNGANICDQESNRQEHARDHDSEPRAQVHKLEDSPIESRLEDPEQVARDEDPPRIACEGLDRPEASEVVIARAVEEFEVGPQGGNPVRLHEKQGANVYDAASSGEKGPDLQPRDEVVQEVRDVEQQDGAAAIPVSTTNEQSVLVRYWICGLANRTQGPGKR